jgi:hypothetical protein
MKVKVTNKVKGEMVIACLGGSLKKNDVINIDAYKSSHQDVLWAIHHGYLEILDKSPESEPMGDAVCFINCTNRTLTGKMFAKALDPSRSIVVKKTDPVFSELVRMADAGKLKMQVSVSSVPTPSSAENTIAMTVTSVSKVEAKPTVRNSFNKNAKSTSKKKADPTPSSDILNTGQENIKINAKTGNGVTVLHSKEPIFVDMNGEVT